MKRLNTDWLLRTFFLGELRYAGHFAWCGMLNQMITLLLGTFAVWWLALIVGFAITTLGSTYKEYFIDVRPDPNALKFNMAAIMLTSLILLLYFMV